MVFEFFFDVNFNEVLMTAEVYGDIVQREMAFIMEDVSVMWSLW